MTNQKENKNMSYLAFFCFLMVVDGSCLCSSLTTTSIDHRRLSIDVCGVSHFSPSQQRGSSTWREGSQVILTICASITHFCAWLWLIRDMRNPGFVCNSGLPEECSWPHACACFPTYEPTLGPDPIHPGAQTNLTITCCCRL